MYLLKMVDVSRFKRVWCSRFPNHHLLNHPWLAWKHLIHLLRPPLWGLRMQIWNLQRLIVQKMLLNWGRWRSLPLDLLLLAYQRSTWTTHAKDPMLNDWVKSQASPIKNIRMMKLLRLVPNQSWCLVWMTMMSTYYWNGVADHGSKTKQTHWLKGHLHFKSSTDN